MAYVSGGGYGCYWSQNFEIDVGDQQYITDAASENKDVVMEVYGNESLCSIKNFVIRLYENVLERNPDVQGLAGWTAEHGTAKGGITAMNHFLHVFYDGRTRA